MFRRRLFTVVASLVWQSYGLSLTTSGAAARELGFALSPSAWFQRYRMLPIRSPKTVALFYIGPGFYAIFGRSSVIMTAVLALVMFPEERHILRQWQFQLGTLLGLLVAVGVFWFQPEASAGHIGTTWNADRICRDIVLGALRHAGETILGATLSIRSFGVVSLLTSALLFPLTCAFDISPHRCR